MLVWEGKTRFTDDHSFGMSCSGEVGEEGGGGVLFCVRATVTVKSTIPASSINTDQHIIYCKKT